MKFSLPVLILLAFSLCTSAGNAQEEWRVDPDFRGKKARKDISGAVCNPVRCIAVNDETNYAQAFSVGKNRIKPGKRIVLAEKGDEIDAEAIAYSGGTFYIAGSHGVSRKKGKERDASYQVFRVEGDDITVSGRLPELKKYASKRLNKNGVNIEGIAARGDRLFFGFRGPSVKGQAYILETSAKTLFSDELIAPTLHRLSLGDRSLGAILWLSGRMVAVSLWFSLKYHCPQRESRKVFWSSMRVEITTTY